MILTSMPVHLLAANVDHNNLLNSKSKIINNKTPVMVAKPEGTAADLIKNPDQPAIYTLRTDYKVQRGEKYQVNYQPYIASVGAAATEDEQKKVNKTVKLPDLAGYEKPDDDYLITYDKVKNAGNNGSQEFRYKAKSNQITIKHVFQDLEDFTKYTNPNGSVGEEGQLITTQNGNTGSTMEVSPLNENDPRRKGFVPEAESINMQVPENAENFILEYRYNRAHYDVVFDTAGGTEIPARTLYYEQVIPKIADESIPTKVGGEFQGWKPSVDLKTKDGKTYKANEIIKAGTAAITNLDANLIMPASKVTFTAVWKDKEKADYAIQFWAEKADHADDASLLDKYDYIGTRVYKDQDTGSRPDLDNEPVKNIIFPDLDKARLNKIWNGETFNRRKNKLLDKFFVYNQALTHDQNKDPENVNLVKSVDSTGKTVYNIYYDRQVYDLYFTKSNAQPEKNTIYPEIWGYDTKKGESVMLGGPGNPYHYKARFNEMMYKWPNDAKQTKGFTPGYQSFGWGPNYTVPNFPLHLDTPPYRLNADEFLDMANYTNWGGYTKKIDKGDGTTMDLDRFDFTTLSFGIKQDKPSIPHHMDFWMDGFKDGETIIRYDLVRTKADTAGLGYGHRYPQVTGFTPYGYNPRSAWPAIAEGSQEDGRVNEEGINELNDERDEITPNNSGTYYNNYGTKLPIGQLDFISVFFSDADDFGDVKEGGQEFEENGYLRFKYHRNKYPLRFNYDPSKIKDDSEFNSTNQLDTLYEFPLKALSPDLEGNEEYKKENPKNLLDNPEKLQELGLKDLVFTDPQDNKLKVKRPDNLSDQMVFKGWALDPAGSKLIWENPKETMPFHPVNLYAKWGEPDYKWKVTFDPNGGSLRNIKEDNLTTSRKKIQEGDIGQEEINTYAKKEDNDGDKQIFTVIQRQKLVEPKYKPTRKGYDFMGWEVIRYKKNAKGDYTDEIDTSYRDTYKVPELYSFGNDVVAPVYLKAIWVPNARVDVKVEHYMLDKDYKLVKKLEDTLEAKRANYLVATTGDKQDDEYILAPHEELEKKLTGDLKTTYEEYNKRVKGDNTFFQQFRVEPAQILNTETNKLEDNPKVIYNIFKFFYIPFRQREYKVNYIDERFKGKETQEGAAIIDQELVSNGNRHYDARNYRRIPGWVLAENEKPQQQLFFDVNEKTNKFLGINGTGKDEITFYYKDVRVIEVSNKDDPVPDGYVRVTYKADKGGAFTDKDGNSKTELYYDVIKGLKSDLLPVPKELAEGEEKVADKYYITPETGKKFTKWDKSPLLNKNTIINEAHTFTAYFEWSGLSASGLVRTEAFTDPNGTWTNNFAPTIDQLKKQLVWREKDEVKPLPAGAVIKLYDEKGNELTKDDQVYELVNEKKAADKDELVRTVNVKAKVTFKDGKEPQELDIPITVYKNVYEALNKAGDKPLFLKEAEGKEAKDGGLKDITGNYVKVTVQPTEKNTNKDAKVYYVNPKAWVNIPEVEWSQDDKDKTDFLKWTADQKEQNEKKEETGIFDFKKRHKFTDEETLIKPLFTNDVVEQKEGEDKPKVPDNFVKVIVKTTEKATDETKFEKTFWVNPTKEVTIPVASPTGKTDQEVDIPKLGKKKVNYVFKEWQKVQTGEADDKLTEVKPAVKIELAKNKYTDKVTVIEAVYNERFAATPIVKPIKTEELYTPEGKEITDKDLIEKITPPANKEIESITVVEKPDPSKPGKQEAKITIKYKDGSTQGTNDNPVVIPVEVHKNIIPEAPGGQKPKDAMDNYVKVIFKAGTGGSVSGDLVYYVSPEVEVDLTESAGKVTKTPDIGYFVNGEKWTNTANKTLKGTFTDAETEFVFTFDKSKDIIEKIDENTKKPDDYVTVIFRADDHGKLEGDETEKIYYVNPKAGIKLVELADGQTAGEKQLAVPKTVADKNYVFEKWYEAIDKDNPVTNNLEYVARFVKDGVTLTYEAGGAEGKVPEVVTVAQGTSVRLASAAGLTKKNAKFAGWKIGEKIYQAGDLVTLEESKTAVAQWTNDQNIIPYDPVNNPTTIPDDTYVRVTFEADEGLTLSNVKYYYVKKNSGVTLKELAKPGYSENVGYKFDKWDKEDKLVIEAANIVVTAKATKLDNVIPEKDEQGKQNKKPEGYKEVTFVIKDDDKDKGSITGVAKFYVNPTEYVTINPPTTKANTGFEFGAWDKNTLDNIQYKEDTTITGSFNGLEDVIPKTNPDGTENKKPDGYKTVTFVINPATGGKIADKEVTVYYVNPAKEVTVPQPATKAETGYEFEKWNQDTATAKKYTEDTTVKGNFNKLKDIIPSTNDEGKQNPKPEGYVTVTFDKGEHGTKIEGQTVYYVNPKAGKTIGKLTKPTVKETETGWKQKADSEAWDTKDTTQITGPADILLKAQYDPIADVVPKDNPQGGENEKPENYITVTFVKGEHGELEGNTVFYINPNKAVVLEDKAPTIKPNTGYTSAGWDTTINKAIQYKGGDKITALYNVLGDVIPKTNPDGTENKQPAGYKKVEFVIDPATGGKIVDKEVTVYYVNPAKKVTIPQPKTQPDTGYVFEKWDQDTTAAKEYDKDVTVKGTFKKLDDIIPGDKTKPDGYVTVKFVADKNGSLSGTTVYYVNPNVEVNLTDKANAITKNPNVGFTEEGGKWINNDSKAIIDKFNKDTEFKFNFVKLDDVIPAGDKVEQPKGYVKVEFTSDANGSLEGGDKTYYVNPSKKVKVGSENLPIPTPKPNDNYKFVQWLENIDKDEEITTDKRYVATFKINKVTMTYKADDKTSGDVPEALSYDIGTEITLAGGVNLKKDNYVLVAWSIGNKSYLPGAKYTIKKDTVATAVWSAGTHTVEFNTVGGTYIPSQKVKHNELITQVKNPEKQNYTFIGWKVDGEDFDPATKQITKDITLVAQYVPDVIPQEGTEKPKNVPDNFVEVKFVPTDKATDSTPQIFWVNPEKEVTIPVKDPVGKQYFTFKEWKIGKNADGAVYTPSTAKKFTAKETVITATYDEAKNIIPYDPNEPITKPKGYVRVTFEAKEGLTLSNVKYYYVKKNSGVTLEKLTKPNVNAKVGFEFNAWDKKDALEIKDDDVVVTAQPTPIADAIEVKKGVKKPYGYVEVKFVAGDNGTVEPKSYFVNPSKYVTLTPPTAKGDTGFKFGTWDKDATIPTVYKKDTTITASFNPVDSVIPKTKDGQQKPEGYVTVNFVIKGDGGQIANGETITYFVNPEKDVTINPPATKAETGYVFEKWNPDTTTKAKYEKDTTVTGSFKKLEDIIPSTDKDGKPNAQPVGYVTVTFDKGANGNLTGQTSYFVNPNAGKKLADITKPTVTPETGYKFAGWDTKDEFAIKDDKTVTAKYEAIADVIPKTKKDDSEKPAGYITVTFDTTEKGKIKDSTAKTKVVFVNPNKAVVLKGFAPEVVANKGHEFERWDTSIEKPIQYKDKDTIKAIYKDDNTPGGTTPGDKPGDKPGDNPGGTTPGGTTPGDQPGTKPGENPETPGTVPENPGAIPGTKPGVVEKHGNRYVERVAGKNRVYTAINTSKRFFKKSKYVIIADSGNYPDALTATVLAHVLDAPILLNNTRYLEDDVAREIVRLGASEVIIVGGHKSISENVKSQLAKFDANKVQRIWGRDRYVTSSELAYEIERLTGKVNKAIIASGENFPDALATAPLGSKEIAPILLVTRNQMDKKVSKALKDLSIKRVYVAGGQNSVSKKLESQLPQVIRRFSGQDRYETAILVASYTYPESKEVFVASGETFPDALVIGPVCARRKAPILLSKSTPVKVTDDYIEKSKIEYLYIIGGTNTIYAETAHKYAIED